MEKRILQILTEFYDDKVPNIKEVQVLSDSPKEGITSIRWRDQEGVQTVKAIGGPAGVVITRLK